MKTKIILNPDKEHVLLIKTKLKEKLNDDIVINIK